jgi:hypothetical protein
MESCGRYRQQRRTTAGAAVAKGFDGEMGNTEDLSQYRYRGARASVILHEQQIREFVDTWKIAKSSGAPLPETDDPSYQSFDTLLRHVLKWAREYMVWMCEKLELQDPEILPVPEVNEVAEKAEAYLDHLLAQWRAPLSAVAEERFYKPEYIAPHTAFHAGQLAMWRGALGRKSVAVFV